MRILKSFIVVTVAFAGIAATPAMATMANETAENRTDDEVRPVKKQKESPAKEVSKQAPKRETCRSCRILM